MPSTAVSRRRPSVCGLSVRNYMLKVSERDILPIACGHFTTFTTHMCSWGTR